MRIIIGNNQPDSTDVVLMLDKLSGIDKSVQQVYLAFTAEEANAMQGNVRKDAELHNKMMVDFFARKWNKIPVYLILLTTNDHPCFSGRLNKFYQSLQNRVNSYKITPPPADWQGIYWVP